jgi:hypothetical protein
MGKEEVGNGTSDGRQMALESLSNSQPGVFVKRLVRERRTKIRAVKDLENEKTSIRIS